MKYQEVKIILEELLKADKNRRLHPTLTTGRFYNGTVKSHNSKKIIFIDDKLGEIPLPHSQILNIDPWVDK